MVLRGDALGLGSDQEWRLEFLDEGANCRCVGWGSAQADQYQRTLGRVQPPSDLFHACRVAGGSIGQWPRFRRTGMIFNCPIARQCNMYRAGPRCGGQIQRAADDFYRVQLRGIE